MSVKVISVKYLCNLSGMGIGELAKVLGVHEQTLYKHHRNAKDLLTSPQCREVLLIMEKFKETPFENEVFIISDRKIRKQLK